MQVKKKRSPVILQDKMALALLMFLFAGQTVGIWCSLLLPSNTPLDAYIFFGMIWAVLPIVVLLDPWRYVMWNRFSEEGVESHTLFRRKRVEGYEKYPYLLHGKYLHGVYWRHYIILTDRRLKDMELRQINHVAPSEHMIKVQYSKKVYDVLAEVLPPKQRASLTAIQWEDPKK